MVKVLKTRKYRNKKGFTLIELLIVVAIIGILAAIAIPAFNQYKLRSFNATAQTDLRSLQAALEGYFADNFNYPY